MDTLLLYTYYTLQKTKSICMQLQWKIEKQSYIKKTETEKKQFDLKRTAVKVRAPDWGIYGVFKNTVFMKF